MATYDFGLLGRARLSIRSAGQLAADRSHQSRTLRLNPYSSGSFSNSTSGTPFRLATWTESSDGDGWSWGPSLGEAAGLSSMSKSASSDALTSSLALDSAASGDSRSGFASSDASWSNADGRAASGRAMTTVSFTSDSSLSLWASSTMTSIPGSANGEVWPLAKPGSGELDMFFRRALCRAACCKTARLAVMAKSSALHQWHQGKGKGLATCTRQTTSERHSSSVSDVIWRMLGTMPMGTRLMGDEGCQ